MRGLRIFVTGLTIVVAAILFSLVTAAQSTEPRDDQGRDQRNQRDQYVTTGDIQRLQDEIYTVGSDISRLRSRDASLADTLQRQLDDLRDEAIYLKVKLRKEGNVPRAEYWDLRDRVDSLQARVRDGMDAEGRIAPPPPSPGRNASPPYQEPPEEVPPPQQPRTSNPDEVPVGSELDVRLQTPLSSATARVEDAFEVTTMVDLGNDNRVLIPAGSSVRGLVTSVNRAGRVDRKGSLTLSFDRITIRGRSYPIQATVNQVLESEGVRGEAAKIGAGAGVGAIIGGILGGAKGALAGILIGGGGTVAATTGKDIDLPPGTVLRMRFDSPLIVRPGR
jgi:hypothetical protein